MQFVAYIVIYLEATCGTQRVQHRRMETEMNKTATAKRNSAAPIIIGIVLLAAIAGAAFFFLRDTTGNDRTIKVGKEVHTVAISPDGTFIVTGMKDKVAKIWDTKTVAQIASNLSHKGTIVALALSQDGRFVLTGADDNTTKL